MHTSRARSGAHHQNTHFTHRDGPRSAGTGLRHPGLQREDGCMQPGRSQGNQLPGRWTGASVRERVESDAIIKICQCLKMKTVYGSRHSGASRALHAKPWVNGSDPDQGMHPWAGRVSEGRIHGTRKPGRSAASEATALASIGRRTAPVNRLHQRESGAEGSVPSQRDGQGLSTGRMKDGPEGQAWPRAPIARPAARRFSLGTPAHGKTGQGPLGPAELVRGAADSPRPTPPHVQRAV